MRGSIKGIAPIVIDLIVELNLFYYIDIYFYSTHNRIKLKSGYYIFLKKIIVVKFR